MRCLPDVTGPVLETRPFQEWVHDSNRERTREIMKSLKCNVINIWGSNWVPSSVLSLCKIWRVRLSSFSLESLCPWLSSRMVLLGPEGGLAQSSRRRMECPLPEKFVTWACWVESEGLLLGVGQPPPAIFSSYPWGKPGFQAAEESKGD